MEISLFCLQISYGIDNIKERIKEEGHLQIADNMARIEFCQMNWQGYAKGWKISNFYFALIYSLKYCMF